MSKWRGILPAAVTPFRQDGAVDEAAFAEHLERLIAAGVSGLVINAVTGEGQSLTPAERAMCVRIARETAAGRVPVIATVGSVCESETLGDIRAAESAGAAGLMIITPYFYRLSQQERIDFFVRMGRSTALPFIIYNSTYSNAQLDVAALEAIASATPTFVGLKEGNQLQASEVIRRLAPQVAVYTSRDTYIFELAACGGAGAVTYSSNVAPDLTVGLWQAVEAGNWDGALARQRALNPIAWALVEQRFPSAIKACMNAMNWRAGIVRKPLTDLTSAEAATLVPLLCELHPWIAR